MPVLTAYERSCTMNNTDLAKNRSGAETYRWYSWDSPLGLGLFLVCLAAVGVLVRFAIVLR